MRTVRRYVAAWQSFNPVSRWVVYLALAVWLTAVAAVLGAY